MRTEKVNLEQVVRRVKSQLSWSIRECYGPGGFAIHSNARTLEHTLCWPCGSSGAQGGYLPYIHELVHAELAERLDPLFSTISVAEEDTSLVDHILPSLRAATDWFVEQRVLTLCRDMKLHELHARCRAVIDILCTETVPRQDVPALALVLAQGRVHLNMTRRFDPLTEALMEAFGRTPAHAPSLHGLSGLSDRLVRTVFGFGVSLVRHQGVLAWRIRR